jgi:hypothetical protein
MARQRHALLSTLIERVPTAYRAPNAPCKASTSDSQLDVNLVWLKRDTTAGVGRHQRHRTYILSLGRAVYQSGICTIPPRRGSTLCNHLRDRLSGPENRHGSGPSSWRAVGLSMYGADDRSSLVCGLGIPANFKSLLRRRTWVRGAADMLGSVGADHHGLTRPHDRNVIGSHGGSYALYRALAQAPSTDPGARSRQIHPSGEARRVRL